MNVGWGKKETQFHGSLGKEAAKQKSEVWEVIYPSQEIICMIVYFGMLTFLSGDKGCSFFSLLGDSSSSSLG